MLHEISAKEVASCLRIPTSHTDALPSPRFCDYYANDVEIDTELDAGATNRAQLKCNLEVKAAVGCTKLPQRKPGIARARRWMHV